MVMFGDALRSLPKGTRLRILDMEFSPEGLQLEGQVRTHGDADVIAAGLRAVGGYAVDPPHSEARAEGKGISFTIDAPHHRRTREIDAGGLSRDVGPESAMNRVRQMTIKRQLAWMATLAMTLLLANLWAWSNLMVQRRGEERAELDVVTCSRLAERIRVMRDRPTIAGSSEIELTELSKQIEAAAAAAGMQSGVLVRISPSAPRPEQTNWRTVKASILRNQPAWSSRG